MKDISIHRSFWTLLDNRLKLLLLQLLINYLLIYYMAYSTTVTWYIKWPGVSFVKKKVRADRFILLLYIVREQKLNSFSEWWCKLPNQLRTS